MIPFWQTGWLWMDPCGKCIKKNINHDPQRDNDFLVEIPKRKGKKLYFSINYVSISPLVSYRKVKRVELWCIEKNSLGKVYWAISLHGCLYLGDYRRRMVLSVSELANRTVALSYLQKRISQWNSPRYNSVVNNYVGQRDLKQIASLCLTIAL
jgi:hypothetical protein